jgi:hypothetical protein
VEAAVCDADGEAGRSLGSAQVGTRKPIGEEIETIWFIWQDYVTKAV